MMPGSLIMAVISPFGGRFFDRFGITQTGGMGQRPADDQLSGGGFCKRVYTGPLHCGSLYCTTDLYWFDHDAYRYLGNDGGWDRKRAAHGTALLTSLRTISGAFGSAIFVAVMTGVTG